MLVYVFKFKIQSLALKPIINIYYALEHDQGPDP
jgi:hypothetical protein